MEVLLNQIKGKIWKHYITSVPKATFYDTNYESNVTIVFNPYVSVSKSFLTINYEGTQNWRLSSLETETDTSVIIKEYYFPSTLAGLEDQLFENKFKKKENKYFANILNISAVQEGEIQWGQSISGIKGFYATATFACLNGSVDSITNQKAELYAVSAEYVESSY